MFYHILHQLYHKRTNMNLYPRIYHYIGEITLENGYTLKQERLPNEGIDPWLFLVFDKKGKKRFNIMSEFIKNPPREEFVKKLFAICLF